MGGNASKVFHGITAVSKGILHTDEGAIHGGMLGGEAGGPIGAGIGAIGSGLVHGLSQIDPIISSFKGSNQNVPVNPQDISDIIHRTSNVFQRGGNLVQNSPAFQTALSDATRGKISRGLLQMGQYADAANKGVSSVLYRGGLNPTDVEKFASPVMNFASTQLSRRQQREVDTGRGNAMLLSTLAPQQTSDINPSNSPA
jgi:hypothetical protein